MLYIVRLIVLIGLYCSLSLVYTREICTGENVCQLNDSSLRFFLLGDFGGQPIYPYKSFTQKRVAKKIAEMGKKRHSHFQLELGDNFYIVGVENVNDSRFKDTFEDTYTHSSAMYKPWYILAGNHDHYGNVSAQVEYSKKSTRWVFPSLFYRFRYQFAEGRALAEFIMIDTVILCGNNKDIEFASNWEAIFESSHEVSTPKPEKEESARKHWDWLENRLNESNADFLFVLGHFPLYSVRSEGSTPCLIEKLQPLLHRYRVSAYMAGHDHNVQHLQIKKEGWTTNYIVSGAASRSSQSTAHINSVPSGSLKFQYPTHWNPVGPIGFSYGAFVYGHLTRNIGYFQFYTGKGHLKYSFSLARRF